MADRLVRQTIKQTVDGSIEQSNIQTAYRPKDSSTNKNIYRNGTDKHIAHFSGLFLPEGRCRKKHAGRNPQIWGAVKGNSESINRQAMEHINDILKSPGDFMIHTTDRGISFLEKKLPDGRGMRLNMDGSFKGFIDK